MPPSLADQTPENNNNTDSLSQVDLEIIQQLSLLENLDYLETEDVTFLQNYDSLDNNTNSDDIEGETDEEN